MPRGRGSLDLTDFTRGRIIGLWETEQSQRGISRRLCIPLSTINRVIVQFKNNKKTTVAYRPGRPGPSERTLRAVRRRAETNPRQTAAELAVHVKVSSRTIRRYLHSMGYYCGAGGRTPTLVPRNIVRTEKNASDWSEGKLNSFFKNLSFQEPGLGTVTVTELSRCKGEAVVDNHKGELLFFYDWNIELEWKATPETNKEEESKDIKGKIEIVNFSEENELHEIDINVSVVKGASKGDEFKEFIRIKGINHIREKIALYIEALRDKYASDLILPTKTQAQSVTKQSKTIISQDLANNVKNIIVSTPSERKDTVGLKFHTTTINMSQNFKCTADEIYKALTIKEMVCAFTRNDVKLDAEKGGKFELFGGNVSGEFVDLKPQEKIVQKWRFKSWPSNHYSEVTLTFSQGEDSTRVDLQQSGVPVGDLDRTRQGWQNYYWDGIRRTFGFGAKLI